MVTAANEVADPLTRFSEVLSEATATTGADGFLDHQTDCVEELESAKATFENDVGRFEVLVEETSHIWQSSGRDNRSLMLFAEQTGPLSDSSRDLIVQADLLYKLLSRLGEARRKRNGRGNLLKSLDQARNELVEHLKAPRYFRRQAKWLQERFSAGRTP